MARKILLADDSVTAQNMGRKILADAGYEVITVNNGSAALKKIAELKPDLIVLDVYMPGYSGLEVCQRLKEAPETSRVPVLLTVGKLEPFKPEEAKRVRADGFIVKPFEASELLSALSKLEDKIVPRAEASKPGRFARVTAAIEEGRHDKTVAHEADLGWKNRISFPSKNKEKSAAEDNSSAAFSNAAMSERKFADRPQPIKAEEPRVDLAALAPEGLPKDVTPEEIAALAAAAAQVKGKMAEFTDAPPVQPRTEETELTVAFPQEVSATVAPVAPVAEQNSEDRFAEKIEGPKDQEQAKSSEAAAEAASMAAASHSDLMAAIASLEAGAAASPGSGLEKGFSSQGAADETENEPVTMAMPAGVAEVGGGPRWTAVSVALGKDESAISLEHEMQKAYAAFAAAVNGNAPSIPAVPDGQLEPVEPAVPTESASTPGTGLAESMVSIPAMPAPEAIPIFNELGSGSTEAIRAAVQDLEMVAESYPGEAAASAGPETAPAEAEASAQIVSETPQAAEAVAEETPTAAAEEPHPEAATLDTAKRSQADSGYQKPKDREWHSEGRHSEDRRSEGRKSEAWKNKGSFVALSAERHEITPPAVVNEIPAEPTFSSQVSSVQDANAGESAAVGSGEIGKQESDAAASPAAAWASWRRIRESGDSRTVSEEPTQKETQQMSAPQGAAAMAVAAGAEKTPEDSGSDPASIASIVDSVLADLRPKIFEEISRQMGKKK